MVSIIILYHNIIILYYNIIILYYNIVILMRPLSYLRSIVDRNVMQRMTVDGTKSHFTSILHSSGTSLRLNCYVSLKTDQACTCISTSMQVAISNICVTRVNMRNVLKIK